MEARTEWVIQVHLRHADKWVDTATLDEESYMRDLLQTKRDIAEQEGDDPTLYRLVKRTVTDEVIA